MAYLRLKIWPKFFENVLDGSKRFELRRDCRVAYGDVVELEEWDPTEIRSEINPQEGASYYIPVARGYTGRKTAVRVTYALWGLIDIGGPLLPEGVCCFSFEVLP